MMIAMMVLGMGLMGQSDQESESPVLREYDLSFLEQLEVMEDRMTLNLIPTFFFDDQAGFITGENVDWAFSPELIDLIGEVVDRDLWEDERYSLESLGKRLQVIAPEDTQKRVSQFIDIVFDELLSVNRIQIRTLRGAELPSSLTRADKNDWAETYLSRGSIEILGQSESQLIGAMPSRSGETTVHSMVADWDVEIATGAALFAPRRLVLTPGIDCLLRSKWMGKYWLLDVMVQGRDLAPEPRVLDVSARLWRGHGLPDSGSSRIRGRDGFLEEVNDQPDVLPFTNKESLRFTFPQVSLWTFAGTIPLRAGEVYWIPLHSEEGAVEGIEIQSLNVSGPSPSSQPVPAKVGESRQVYWTDARPEEIGVQGQAPQLEQLEGWLSADFDETPLTFTETSRQGRAGDLLGLLKAFALQKETMTPSVYTDLVESRIFVSGPPSTIERAREFMESRPTRRSYRVSVKPRGIDEAPFECPILSGQQAHIYRGTLGHYLSGWEGEVANFTSVYDPRVARWFAGYGLRFEIDDLGSSKIALRCQGVLSSRVGDRTQVDLRAEGCPIAEQVKRRQKVLDEVRILGDADWGQSLLIGSPDFGLEIRVDRDN